VLAFFDSYEGDVVVLGGAFGKFLDGFADLFDDGFGADGGCCLENLV